ERRPRQSKYDFYRIQAKTVDFVLCDTQTTAPKLVVELDDSSHQLAHRRERDTFVDQVMASVGLPILHVGWQHTYERDTLEQAICAQLGIRPQPTPLPLTATPAPQRPSVSSHAPTTHMAQVVPQPLPQVNQPALAGQHIVDTPSHTMNIACG